MTACCLAVRREDLRGIGWLEPGDVAIVSLNARCGAAARTLLARVTVLWFMVASADSGAIVAWRPRRSQSDESISERGELRLDMVGDRGESEGGTAAGKSRGAEVLGGLLSSATWPPGGLSCEAPCSVPCSMP